MACSQLGPLHCTLPCLAVCPGDIDFGEFKQMVYDGLLLEGAIQDYEDAFNAVDNSGNGSIGETRTRSRLALLPLGCCCRPDTVL